MISKGRKINSKNGIIRKLKKQKKGKVNKMETKQEVIVNKLKNSRVYKQEITKVRLGYGISSYELTEEEKDKDYRIERVDIIQGGKEVALYINGKYDSVHNLDGKDKHKFIRLMCVHLRQLLKGVEITLYSSKTTYMDIAVASVLKKYKEFSAIEQVLLDRSSREDVQVTKIGKGLDKGVYKVVSDVEKTYIFKDNGYIYGEEEDKGLNLVYLLQGLMSAFTKIGVYYVIRDEEGKEVSMPKVETYEELKSKVNLIKYTREKVQPKDAVKAKVKGKKGLTKTTK